MADVPKTLKYSRSHNWLASTEDDLLRIGISDFAQDELGDIVYVQLPELGKTYKSGDACGIVESVKSASDIYCPITATIKAVNDKLNDHPELINTAPYGEGWIFATTRAEATELEQLLSAAEYIEFTKNS